MPIPPSWPDRRGGARPHPHPAHEPDGNAAERPHGFLRPRHNEVLSPEQTNPYSHKLLSDKPGALQGALNAREGKQSLRKVRMLAPNVMVVDTTNTDATNGAGAETRFKYILEKRGGPDPIQWTGWLSRFLKSLTIIWSKKVDGCSVACPSSPSART